TAESVVSRDSLVGGGASSRSTSAATRISALDAKYGTRPDSVSKLSASQSTIRTDILMKEGVEYGDADCIDADDEDEAVVPVDKDESCVSLPMPIDDMPAELAAVLRRTGAVDDAKLRRLATPSQASRASHHSSAHSNRSTDSRASKAPSEAVSARPDSASIRSTATSARPDNATVRSSVTSARPDNASIRSSVTSARPDSASIRSTTTSARPDNASVRSSVTSARPDNASVRSAVSTARSAALQSTKAESVKSGATGHTSLTELDIVMGRTGGAIGRSAATSRASVVSGRASVVSKPVLLRGGSGSPMTPTAAPALVSNDSENELASVMRLTSGYAPSSSNSCASSQASESRPESVASEIKSVYPPEALRPASGAGNQRPGRSYAPGLREQAASPARSAVRAPAASGPTAASGYTPSPLRQPAYQPMPASRAQQQSPPPAPSNDDEARSEAPPSPMPYRLPTPIFGRFPSPPRHIKERAAQQAREDEEAEAQRQREEQQQQQPPPPPTRRELSRNRAHSQSASHEEPIGSVRQFAEDPVVDRLDLETGSLASRRSRPRNTSEFGSASTLMNGLNRDSYDLPKVVEEDIDSLASYPSSLRANTPVLVGGGYGYHKSCMRCQRCSQVTPVSSAVRIKGAIYCKKHGTELLRRRSILMRKKSTMGRRSRHNRSRADVSSDCFVADPAVEAPPVPQMPMFGAVDKAQSRADSRGAHPRQVTTALRNFLEAAAEQIESQTFAPITPEPQTRAEMSPPRTRINEPTAKRPLPVPKPKAKQYQPAMKVQVPQPRSIASHISSPPPSPGAGSRSSSRSIFSGSRDSLYDPNVVNALRQEAQRQINSSQPSMPASPTRTHDRNAQRMLSPCGPSIADALQKFSSGKNGRTSVSSEFDPFESQDPLTNSFAAPQSPAGFSPNVQLDNLERRFRNANFRPPWALKSQSSLL
ncbi:hypothetical protein GGH16_002704, partial [Coemansia sp. RSA 560]